MTVEFVERTFGASLAVIHESSHVVAAALLDLPIVGAAVAGDGGYSITMSDRGDPRELAASAVVFAAPVAIHERLGIPFAGCEHDLDHVAVIDREYEALTGHVPTTWPRARQLVWSPEFAAGMGRIVPALQARGLLTGADVAALLHGLPGFRVTVPEAVLEYSI